MPLNFLVKSPPRLGGAINYVEFDAVLEDTLDAGVTISKFSLENGATASDHMVINPIKYKMKIAVGDQKMGLDFARIAIGGASNLFSDNIFVSFGAGLSTGFLTGDEEDRASSALELLLKIQYLGEPFDVDAGDMIIEDMMITKIMRKKTPNNENSLIAEIDLEQSPRLGSLLAQNEPPLSYLTSEDDLATQTAGEQSKGEAGNEEIDFNEEDLF